MSSSSIVMGFKVTDNLEELVNGMSESKAVKIQERDGEESSVQSSQSSGRDERVTARQMRAQEQLTLYKKGWRQLSKRMQRHP